MDREQRQVIVAREAQRTKLGIGDMGPNHWLTKISNLQETGSYTTTRSPGPASENKNIFYISLLRRHWCLFLYHHNELTSINLCSVESVFILRDWLPNHEWRAQPAYCLSIAQMRRYGFITFLRVLMRSETQSRPRFEFDSVGLFSTTITFTSDVPANIHLKWIADICVQGHYYIYTILVLLKVIDFYFEQIWIHIFDDDYYIFMVWYDIAVFDFLI